MNEIEKIRRKVKELQDEFISIHPKDCSLELIKSYAGYVYLNKVLSFIDYIESEKVVEQEKEVSPCHKTRNRLSEWSKTPEGRAAYEKVAEEMRNEIAITNNPDESEKPSDGLEEEYKDYVESDPVYSKLVNRNAGLSIARHFAEWQKAQDDKMVDIIYQQGIEKGKDEMREKAIEGNIFFHPHFQTPVISVEGINPEAFSNDTKVKLVILKNDE